MISESRTEAVHGPCQVTFGTNMVSAQYVLQIAATHPSFRYPELFSAAALYDFPLKIVTPEADLYRACIVVELEDEAHVQLLADRCILLKSAYKLYSSAESYTGLHAELAAHPERWAEQMHQTFRFDTVAINQKSSSTRNRAIISTFKYMQLQGKAVMKEPEVEFVVIEDYDDPHGSSEIEAETSAKGKERSQSPQTQDALELQNVRPFHRVYFGRLITHGRARHLISRFNVKTREYFGNTSMEAEMSLLMAGQTLPAPGKIIYDPFVGTGSMLYTAAHWGAHVFGSDIDGRQMRGKNKGAPGIHRAADQYGVRDNILDCLTFDVTRAPWRRGGWIDAIVTDPPYGVRAGAKRLGRSGGRENREQPFLMEDGIYSHLKSDYHPPSKPYELVNLAYDLVAFARYILVPGGRLVFFLPTVTDEFEQVDVPVVEGMSELKHGEGSMQPFGKWGRRLITMEKTALDDGQPHDFLPVAEAPVTAGHKDFAKKFFSKFADSPTPPEGSQTPPPPAQRQPVAE